MDQLLENILLTGSFESCRSLEKPVIPNSVAEIDERAFLGFPKLIEIIIPSSVKKIGNGVFICRLPCR